MSTLPRPSVTPSSIVLTAPDRSVSTSLEVVNRGGGRLQAVISGGAPWLTVEPRNIDDNHVRVAVTIDASGLPELDEATTTLHLEWDRFSLDIPVRVMRLSMAQAWRLYEQGRKAEARQLAQSIMEGSRRPEAPLLIATTYLDEENYAAAARPLTDAASAVAGLDDAALAEGYAIALMRRFARTANAAMPHLREVRYGITLFEEMLALVRESAPALEIQYSALLQDAATRFVEAYPPEVLSGEDLAESRAFVERMRSRIPEDPHWEAWLDASRHDAAPAQILTQEASTAPRSRTWLWLALIVVAGAGALFFLWPTAHLREARSLLAAGRHKEALEALGSPGRGLDANSETLALRARIHFEWARRLFADGHPREGAEHLVLAVHDAPGDPEIRSFKRSAYREWFRTAAAQGRVVDACDALREMQALQPPEPDAAALLKALEPLRQLFTVMTEIVSLEREGSAAADSASKPVDLLNGPHRNDWGTFMPNHGVRWFDDRVQVALPSLFADGRQQLVVAGSDQDGSASVDVYFADISDKNRLEKLASGDVARGQRLDRIREVEVQRTPRRTALLVTFTRQVDPATGQGFLLWGDGDRLHCWTPADLSSLEVKGEPPLIWVKPAQGLGMSAYQWHPTGPTAASP